MNLAKCLAEQFDLDLVSLRLTGDENAVARRLTPPFRRITIVDPDNAGSFARRALYRGVYELRGLISGVPRAAFYESCQNVRRALLRLAAQTAYDLVHLEYWTAGPLLEVSLGAPHILYLHDAAFQTVRQTAELEANPLRRYAMHRRAAKLERFERRMISRASRVHFLSDADHRLFADVAGERGRTVPLLLPRPPRDAAVNQARRVVLFVGHMGHLPNRDAAGWLIKHVVPRVRRVVPAACFRFVGPGLDAATRTRWQRAGIDVAGWVEDLRREYQQSAVAVVPIRIGTGVNVKLLEAMWHGVPVVTTTLGSRATPAPDGGAIIADDPDTFASAIVSLLRDPVRRQSLRDAAWELLEQQHCSEQVRNKVQAYFAEMVNVGHAQPATRAVVPGGMQ